MAKTVQTKPKQPQYKTWKKVNPYLEALDALWTIGIFVVLGTLIPWVLTAGIFSLFVSDLWTTTSLLLVTMCMPISCFIIICMKIHRYKPNLRNHIPPKSMQKSYNHYKKIGFCEALRLMNMWNINIYDETRNKDPRLYLEKDHLHLYNPRGSKHGGDFINRFYYFGSGLSVLMYTCFVRKMERKYKEEMI